MESEEENDKIFRQLKPQKSVHIAEDKTEIIEIRDKHGPMYNSLPKLPIAAAALCCLFNIVVPGFGKSHIYTYVLRN